MSSDDKLFEELRRDVDELLYTLKGRGDADGLVARFNRAEESLSHLAKSVGEIVVTLQGRNSDFGLVDKINILWRSWVAVVGLVGMVAGYLLKTVML